MQYFSVFDAQVLSPHDLTDDLHVHVHGARAVRLMRNRSLTNDEVEAFWRKHGGRPAENGEASPGGSPLAGSPGAVPDGSCPALLYYRSINSVRQV